MQNEVHHFYSLLEQKRYITPILNKIIETFQQDKTTIIGIQGGQGTGKTTLAQYLQGRLREQGYKVESFSIDDFYETYPKRQQLAQQYSNNPFYQISRGMPGTHRIKKLLQTLKNINAGKSFTIPHFDKALHQGAGDIKYERRVKEKQDFILFEGWCVGIPVVSMKDFSAICRKNKINIKGVDPTLKYSRVVIKFIKQYQPLWKYLNYTIMLKPLSSDLHLRWRLQQEKELREKRGEGMSKEAVGYFVDMYLPWTYVCYDKVKAGTILEINQQHHFSNIIFK